VLRTPVTLVFTYGVDVCIREKFSPGRSYYEVGKLRTTTPQEGINTRTVLDQASVKITYSTDNTCGKYLDAAAIDRCTRVQSGSHVADDGCS